MRLPLNPAALLNAQQLAADRARAGDAAAGGDRALAADHPLRALVRDADHLALPVDAADPGFPAVVQEKLDALATLAGVPFPYLVPDVAQLPPESLRTFRVDPAWVAAIRDGVLSVGERATADTLARPAVPAASGAAAVPRTGFLLRSTLVTDYPGLQVRVLDAAGTQLTPLRIDRPAVGVLLVMVAGELAAIDIEEPHHGVRLGVDGDLPNGFVQLRDATGQLLPAAGGAVPSVPVPFRAGSPDGVIDVAELARRITQAGQPAGAPPAGGGGGLALHLLQPPVRQRFGSAP